jgi:glutathione peroxidase-family protein
MAAAATFYDIVETAGDGTTVDFAQFQGKVVYGVNVACR